MSLNVAALEAAPRALGLTRPRSGAAWYSIEHADAPVVVPAWSHADALHVASEAQLISVREVSRITRLETITPSQALAWIYRISDLTPHALEELVIQAEVSASEPLLEQLDDEDEQSLLIFAAEDRAREIIARGPLAQVTCLVSRYSPEELAAILSPSS